MAMQGVSALGTPLYGGVLIGSVTLVFLVRRMWIEAVFVLATLSSVVIDAVLKVLVGRPRPPLYSLNPVDLFLAVDKYQLPKRTRPLLRRLLRIRGLPRLAASLGLAALVYRRDLRRSHYAHRPFKDLPRSPLGQRRDWELCDRHAPLDHPGRAIPVCRAEVSRKSPITIYWQYRRRLSILWNEAGNPRNKDG